MIIIVIIFYAFALDTKPTGVAKLIEMMYIRFVYSYLKIDFKGVD